MDSYASILQVINEVPAGPPLVTLAKDVMGMLHQLRTNAIEFDDPQELNGKLKENLQESCSYHTTRPHIHLTQDVDADQKPWCDPLGTPLASMVWHDLSPENSVLWNNMSDQGKLMITSQVQGRVTQPRVLLVRSPPKHQSSEKVMKKHGNRNAPSYHCSTKPVIHSIAINRHDMGTPSMVTTLLDLYGNPSKGEIALKLLMRK